MRRLWPALAALLLAGCGVQPSGVTDAGDAPTGVAPGVTLYFLDTHDALTPQLRETDRLGTISDAMALLLSGVGDSSLHTDIAAVGTTRVPVITTPGVIQLMTPLTTGDVTPLGIDQIVCTALGVHVQSGGPRTVKVRVTFTQPTPESARLRTCPLLS
ncbi:hypothetical protein [Actinophytocola sp.]|uniref:hypothetical protein n=1 Tax=Actinophytocola sp. TaxID=1872138 RepID=UPI002D6E7B03|nr:hypothetical protein [Actinophytocola sp.]HYQ63615.1 hypothetical protein [Actinophytocola sp.]